MTGLVLCLALLAAPSNAQKQVLNRLESLQSAIRASASTSQERADALQERLLLRSQAMAGEELDDVTRARWACDQAEDLLSTGLSLDRLGLKLVYGYPTDRERAQAQARINAGLAAVVRAEVAVERAIFELERIPASRRSAVQRESLLRLREQERDLRLPLLRGIGLVHRGECCEEGDVQQETMREAEASLFELDERLDGRSAAQASWLRGLALVRLDRFDDAEAAFRTAATNEQAGSDEILAARLGGVSNRSQQGGVDRGVRSAQLLLRRYEEPGQLRDHLLVADHLASLHARLGEHASAASAWNDMRPLLVRSGLNEPTTRALIDERIRRLPVPDPMSTESIDLLLAHMTRADLDQKALTTALRAALLSPDLEPDHRARAMAGLGATLARDRQPLAAARVLLELASSMPRRTEAGPAIDVAARLALETSIAHPTDPEARAVAVDALAVMMTDFPYRPGIDDWRIAAARLATGDARWNDALDAYAAVVPESPQEQEAIRESATVLLLASRDAAWAADGLDVVSAIRQRRLRSDDTTRTSVDLVLIEALLTHLGRSDSSSACGCIYRRTGSPHHA